MIVYGILGSAKDYGGATHKRWDKWRPTIALCSQEDILVEEYHLLHDSRSRSLLKQVTEDIHQVSPGTTVVPHLLDFDKPWDFEEVYAKLFDFVSTQKFLSEKSCEYAINITTGTHVAQVCWFLLAESRRFPGRLLQVSPGKGDSKTIGNHTLIDLQLSNYDQLASRFAQDKLDGEEYLKGGIKTRNTQFNRLVAQIETVAIRSSAPMLISGPTGSGKTELARRIFDLKRRRNQVAGDFVSVNCSTFAGDSATQSALFGHVKGSFTGAMKDRKGFLKAADGGILFLDEIGELPIDSQAMLLHALEHKRFYPFGSDKEETSDFVLIAGTNKDLQQAVELNEFRDDLLSRLDVWCYRLPGLADRVEDIEPNIEYELRKTAGSHSKIVEFNSEAKTRYLKFAISDVAVWRHNFRDLASSIYRMVTLANGARIDLGIVNVEIALLQEKWSSSKTPDIALDDYLGKAVIDSIDPFDQVQLTYVIGTCRKHPSVASASRYLFAVSREQKKSSNDTSRLTKYLSKFGLTWDSITSFKSDCA